MGPCRTEWAMTNAILSRKPRVKMENRLIAKDQSGRMGEFKNRSRSISQWLGKHFFDLLFPTLWEPHDLTRAMPLRGVGGNSTSGAGDYLPPGNRGA